MRFDEFVLRVPGDEFRIRFHENITVLAGVPAIVPRVASSTTPGGNVPEDSDHVYVPLPPVAVKVFARRIPTSLLGGRAGPNGDFTLRGWRTVSAYVSVSDGLPCTALTTNWKLPSEARLVR